jgi:hypothetical protein
MILNDNFSDGDSLFDFSGALHGSSSLKELVLYNPMGVFGSETLYAIPHMIRTNQDFETIKP